MDIVKQVENLILPVVDDLGLELVHVEYRRETHGWVLRFFLDKVGGITLDDCAEASRQISSLLDVEDIISTAFHLEVSSPGLERPLKKSTDFQRFSGSQVKIKTIDPIVTDPAAKGRKTFSGKLVGIEGDEVILQLQDLELRISLSNIDAAHVQPEF